MHQTIDLDNLIKIEHCGVMTRVEESTLNPKHFGNFLFDWEKKKNENMKFKASTNHGR